MSGRTSAPLECHGIPERAARLPAIPESQQAHTALVTADARLSLKPDLNPYRRSYPILTHPRASLPRTSLHAQALHVGKGKGEAPTLQETFPRSLSPLPDRLPLSG